MKRLLCIAALALLGMPSVGAEPIPDAHKTNGFALGCQAYSFRLFTMFEAIEKTAASGAKVIEFYPGQKFSPENPIGFNHDSPKAMREQLKEKLKKHGLIVVAYGVVGLGRDEAANRKVFDFAKDMGIRVINSEPQPEALDLVEKLVKEYDIKVGIHNHPKKPKDPSYKIWDPHYVLSMVKDRDTRIGSCADIGHWVRSGLKPTECLEILKGRVVSSHLKDLGDKLHDQPFGTGKSDIPGILKMYRDQGMNGPISIEYEHNWDSSLPEITQCVEFVKKWNDSK